MPEGVEGVACDSTAALARCSASCLLSSRITNTAASGPIATIWRACSSLNTPAAMACIACFGIVVVSVSIKHGHTRFSKIIQDQLHTAEVLRQFKVKDARKKLKSLYPKIII